MENREAVRHAREMAGLPPLPPVQSPPQFPNLSRLSSSDEEQDQSHKHHYEQPDDQQYGHSYEPFSQYYGYPQGQHFEQPPRQQDLGAEIHSTEADPQVQAALFRTYSRRPHPSTDQPGSSTSAGATPPRRSTRFTSHNHVAGRARVDSDNDE